MRRFLTPIFIMIFIVGCAGTTDVVSAADDAMLIVGSPVAAPPSGLTGAYIALRKAYPRFVSPVDDARVQVALASVTATGGLADNLRNATTPAEQVKHLQGIVTNIKLVLDVASGVPDINPRYLARFQAATALVRNLEATRNLVMPQTKVAAGRGPESFIDPTMTIDQARTVLRR